MMLKTIQDVATARMTLCAIGYFAMKIIPSDDALRVDVSRIIKLMRCEKRLEIVMFSNQLAREYCCVMRCHMIETLPECMKYEDGKRWFLNNGHVRNYLSALADIYVNYGEGELMKRLIKEGRYVVHTSGKKIARDSLMMSGWNCGDLQVDGVCGLLNRLIFAARKRPILRNIVSPLPTMAAKSPDEGEARTIPTDESIK